MMYTIIMFTGPLSKMSSKLEKDNTVIYSLSSGDNTLKMNDLIGSNIALEFHNKITCIECSRPTKKSFFQGHCYPCFINSPNTADCIIRPELCEAHLGKGKDPVWEELYHNQPHFVYFARSSSLKVGVTRTTQMPTRWIDQGATDALVFAETPNRYLAGCIEVELKTYMTDKTSWQAMLKNNLTEDSLSEKKELIAPLLPEVYQHYLSEDNAITHIDYPVLQYPDKVKSINLDKEPRFESRLIGIKGQYLIFETGHVINIRKYTGYHVSIDSVPL